jgi:CheY-like chemotaxis protein
MKRISSLNDNLELVETLGQVLKSAGYESLVTTSEQWALKILRTLPIDLFTQDIKRNGMGGWGFLRAMKSDPTLRHIPVLLSLQPQNLHKRTRPNGTA